MTAADLAWPVGVLGSKLDGLVAARCEDAWFVAAEMAAGDEVERRTSLGLIVIMPVGIIKASAFGDFFGTETEEKEILFSSSFGHFNRCTVACADGQRSIHHKFHVACAAGLIAGGGDLF